MEGHFVDFDHSCLWAKTKTSTAIIRTAVPTWELATCPFVEKETTTFKFFSAVHQFWVLNKLWGRPWGLGRPWDDRGATGGRPRGDDGLPSLTTWSALGRPWDNRGRPWGDRGATTEIRTGTRTGAGTLSGGGPGVGAGAEAGAGGGPRVKRSPLKS